MFYSQVILARKGPLGKIWLAAHFDKKLSKTQIFSTDIRESVQNIIHPSVPLALRVSGHLMLGIVRIYSKKVKYLVTDCTEALWKMKLATKPGKVDIDPQLAMMHIDDLKHFGQISFDTDFPIFENLAFSSQLLKDLDRGFFDLPEEMKASQIISIAEPEAELSRISDFELGRILDRESLAPDRVSLASRRPSARESIVEDLLPSFEDHFEDSLFRDFKEMTPERMEFIPPPPPAPSVSMLPPIEEELEPLPQAEPKIPREKKKVMFIDKRVELLDYQIKHNFEDVQPILRSKVQMPDIIQDLSYNYSELCSELQDIVLITSNITQFPFPKKVIEPEVPREVEFPRMEEVLPSRPRAHRASIQAPSRPSIDVSGQTFLEQPSFTLEPEISFTSYERGPRESTPLSPGDVKFQTIIDEISADHPTEDQKGRFLEAVKDKIGLKGSFDDLCRSQTKRRVAKMFLEILHLKNQNKINVEQLKPYGSIQIEILSL